jgi:hypothetical protein
MAANQAYKCVADPCSFETQFTQPFEFKSEGWYVRLELPICPMHRRDLEQVLDSLETRALVGVFKSS